LRRVLLVYATQRPSVVTDWWDEVDRPAVFSGLKDAFADFA